MIEDFISDFRRRSPEYAAWALFVISEITTYIENRGFIKEEFFKVPARHRVKKESSIRSKAGRYEISDYKNEILDLVGVRFVVLLTSDLNLIEEAISSNPFFKYVKTRDYGVQMDANPELFDYQSIHYSVSPKHNHTVGGQNIGGDVVCEIQIRTLLQHAYAELTHDNIYKPTQVVPPSARRLVARSMALMETTDELFCGTLDALATANRPRNNLLAQLEKIYLNEVSSYSNTFDLQINLEIIDSFQEDINLDLVGGEIETYLDSSAQVVDRIKSKRGLFFLYGQPIIFLLFYLVKTKKDIVRDKWKYFSLDAELKSVYYDLGMAFGAEY